MEFILGLQCYTHLSRSKTPNPHTLITEHRTASCLLTRPHHPLTIPSSEAEHLLLCSYHLRRRGPPWQSKSLPYLGSFWCFPLTELLFQSLFFLFWKRITKRGVSTHWLSFLTSHSIFNPQPSDFTSWFPLLVTMSERLLIKSSTASRNLLFWCSCLCICKNIAQC